MKTFRWILYGVAVLVFDFPLIGTLFTAFKTPAQISHSPPVWVFLPTLENFHAVLAGGISLDFPLFLFNSLCIALAGTLLAIAITLPAAYGIVRFGHGRRTLLPLVTNLRTIPLIVFVIPLYLMFRLVGLLDTRVGLALVACAIDVPLALVLFIGFVQDFPAAIEEAARMDGASNWQIFRHIIVPLSRTIMAAVGILSFIYAWNEFLFGLILSTERATPVSVGATYFLTSFGIKWGQTAAAMILSVAPPVIMGLASYRYLARGMVAGAIKQ